MKKFLIAILLNLLFMLQVLASDFRSYVQTGYKAFNNKDYQTAIYNFEKALEINPDSYDVNCILAVVYGTIGNSKKSEEILIQATKKFPNEWKAYTFLGDIKRAQHLTPTAIDYYEKALSLPSMPQDGKKYYKKLIEESIQEQKNYENLNKSTINNNINPEVSYNIDYTKWQMVYLQGSNTVWTLEYGLIGEDVINYKWTKLFTIKFFDKNIYTFNAKKFSNDFIKLLEQQAANTNRKIRITKLSENDDEVFIEWSIDGRNECEIIRIFSTPKGLYTGAIAQKSDYFSEEEKEKYLSILKSIN